MIFTYVVHMWGLFWCSRNCIGTTKDVIKILSSFIAPRSAISCHSLLRDETSLYMHKSTALQKSDGVKIQTTDLITTARKNVWWNAFPKLCRTGCVARDDPRHTSFKVQCACRFAIWTLALYSATSFSICEDLQVVDGMSPCSTHSRPSQGA